MTLALLAVLAAAPAAQGPANGSLVVIGGGRIGPELVSKMIELAGGPDQPWVIIPTAGDAEEYDGKTVENSLFAKAGLRDVTLLHTRDRRIADTEEFTAPLRRARGVFFAGGRQWRLVDSYLGTRTEREIRAVLERGGVIAGTSAGATIMGSYLVRGARDGNTIMMAAGYEQGFGLLKPVAIDQHLRARQRQNDLLEVVGKHPELLGIGIDESTAIVVEHDEFVVMGPGKVAIYENGRSYYYLTAGAKFDLARRTTRDAAENVSRALPEIPVYRAQRARQAPVIDGNLDDASWQSAPRADFLFPWASQSGDKQPTTARLLWDEKHLYVGYECVDQDITAQYTRRDDPTYKDDAVEIFLNPGPRQTYYYGLEMNSNAVLYDYYFVFPRYLMKRFDMAGIQLKTSRTAAGWQLELAIPWENFEELAPKLPPALGSEWRISLNRWDGREPKRRLSQWSDSGLPEPNPHWPARFGRLQFLNE